MYFQQSEEVGKKQVHGNLTSSVSVSVGDMAKTSLQLTVNNFQLPYLEPSLVVRARLIFCISKHHTSYDVMCTGIQTQGPWGSFPNWFTEWLTGICRTSELVFILRNLLLFPCPMGVCCLVIWNLHFPKIEIKQSFVSSTSRWNGWLGKHQSLNRFQMYPHPLIHKGREENVVLY